MIVAKCKDASDYKGIHPMLDKALDYLNEEFLNSVGNETVYIEDRNLYAMLNLFETVDAEKRPFEAHRDYLDIHVTLEGVERMDMAETCTLTPDEAGSKPEKDFYAYTDINPDFQPIVMKPGMFLVAFPEDAHRVKVKADEPCQVRKIVFKVKL
ncbi:MAG: YhcH/YjgK/YiaL family protein [Oscillospiraceae bacterium]|nr:YhcH/YjgK/YiaL family protein [Oscillospiraceae bacterium]